MSFYVDVVPALIRLRDVGLTLLILTNNASSTAPISLKKAGIAALFDNYFSVAEVGNFKPHPLIYEMVADRLGLEASNLCMAACHFWDAIGVQSVVCQRALIARALTTASSTLLTC